MNQADRVRLLALAENASASRAGADPEKIRATHFVFLETWYRYHLIGMRSRFENCFQDPFPIRSQDTKSWLSSVFQWTDHNMNEYLVDHFTMFAILSEDHILLRYYDDAMRTRVLFTTPTTLTAFLEHLPDLVAQDPLLQITEEDQKVATILVMALELADMRFTAKMIASLFQVQASEFEYILVDLAILSKERALFDLFCSAIPETVSLSLDTEWCLEQVRELIQIPDFDRIDWIIDRVDFTEEQLAEIVAMLRAIASAVVIRETINRGKRDHDPDGPRDLTPNAA